MVGNSAREIDREITHHYFRSFSTLARQIVGGFSRLDHRRWYRDRSAVHTTVSEVISSGLDCEPRKTVIELHRKLRFGHRDNTPLFPKQSIPMTATNTNQGRLWYSARAIISGFDITKLKSEIAMTLSVATLVIAAEPSTVSEAFDCSVMGLPSHHCFRSYRTSIWGRVCRWQQ